MNKLETKVIKEAMEILDTAKSMLYSSKIEMDNINNMIRDIRCTSKEATDDVKLKALHNKVVDTTNVYNPMKVAETINKSWAWLMTLLEERK